MAKTKIENIQARLEALKRLRAEQDKLFNQLERSIAVMELWPEAYNHGPAKAQVTGNVSHLDEMVLTITNPKESRTFPLVEAPYILWPPALQEFETRTEQIQSIKDRLKKQG